MDKCLASLQYFRDALPCEIILVDTGCNREQRKLAERYADKILDFSWCDDFAAARNIGLKASNGEWFLYLDDDEWFENPSKIIEFFTSGEYQKYNSATYLVRNYLNEQGTIYEDVKVGRMVKRESCTAFHGKIHEFLYPCKAPVKNFSTFVHHFGYVFKNEDEKRLHAQRNIKLLEEMVKEQPQEIRWVNQLAQEYYGIGCYEQAIEVCKQGIQQSKDNETCDYIRFGTAYAFLILSYMAKKENEEAQEWLDKALEENAIPEATRAFFYLLGIQIYGETDDTARCRDFVKQYLTEYEKLRNETDIISNETSLVTGTVFQPQRAFPTLLVGIPALILAADYELVKKAFYTIDWQDSRMLGQEEQERKIVDACCRMEFNPLWKEILQTLVSRKDGMNEMYSVFLDLETEYVKEHKVERLDAMRQLIAGLDYPHRYILCTRIVSMARNQTVDPNNQFKEKLTALFEQLFREYPKEILEVKEEIWKIADDWKMNLEPMFLKVEFSIWRRNLEKWFIEASPEEMQQWQHRLGVWKSAWDIRYELFDIKCMEMQLRDSSSALYNIAQIEEIFWKCADKILATYQPYYSDSAFTDEEKVQLLPDEIQFALQLRTLRQAREQGSDREVLEALRALNDTYEPMNGVIAYYAKLYREEVHNRNDEMAQLAAGLKRNVRILIGAGKLDDAKAVITQLEQFIPGDEELQTFKDELRME